MAKCLRHPSVDAVEPFLIFNNGNPIPLCKQDILDLKTLISFKLVEPVVGDKKVTDDIKTLDVVEQQKTIGYKIDIIKNDSDGKKLDQLLK